MSKSYVPSVTELEAFVACAQYGSTVLAAERLNRTQSAVSRSLASLEDRLGVMLFDRVRRRLVLSDAGAPFLDKAERLLADLTDASAAVIAFGGSSAVLRMAVLPSFGRSWLIPRLPGLVREMPGVGVDISARLHPVDFREEPYDLAIMRSQHEVPGAVVEPIFTETLVTIVSPRLLGDRRTLSVDDLLGLPLLQQSTRPTLWLDWFRESDIDPRQILRGARFDHFDMMIDAAIAGLGVGIVPELLVGEALKAGTLCLASDRRFATGDNYSLILPERALTHGPIIAFRDWLLREISSDIGAG